MHVDTHLAAAAAAAAPIPTRNSHVAQPPSSLKASASLDVFPLSSSSSSSSSSCLSLLSVNTLRPPSPCPPSPCSAPYPCSVDPALLHSMSRVAQLRSPVYVSEGRDGFQTIESKQQEDEGRRRARIIRQRRSRQSIERETEPDPPSPPPSSPLPCLILPYLYIGTEQHAASLSILTTHHITHILNTSWEVACFYQLMPSCPFVYGVFPFADQVNQLILPLLDPCVLFIENCRRVNGVCLVHCVQGVSRSPTIAIAYLIACFSWSVEEALIYIQERRKGAQPNPSFIQQLHVYQQQWEERRARRLTFDTWAAAAAGKDKGEQPEMCRQGNHQQSNDDAAMKQTETTQKDEKLTSQRSETENANGISASA